MQFDISIMISIITALSGFTGLIVARYKYRRGYKREIMEIQLKEVLLPMYKLVCSYGTFKDYNKIYKEIERITNRIISDYLIYAPVKLLKFIDDIYDDDFNKEIFVSYVIETYNTSKRKLGYPSNSIRNSFKELPTDKKIKAVFMYVLSFFKHLILISAISFVANHLIVFTTNGVFGLKHFFSNYWSISIFISSIVASLFFTYFDLYLNGFDY